MGHGSRSVCNMRECVGEKNVGPVSGMSTPGCDLLDLPISNHTLAWVSQELKFGVDQIWFDPPFGQGEVPKLLGQSHMTENGVAHGSLVYPMIENLKSH